MKTVAISIGDVNGIGPEIALKSARDLAIQDQQHMVLIGSKEALAAEAADCSMELPPPYDPEKNQAVSFWEPEDSPSVSREPAKRSAEAAKAAICWIRHAVEGCLSSSFDAMVTAPICKESLQMAGLTMPGHTEYIAELCNCDRYAMMLAGKGLRVVLATRHLPLRAVPDALTPECVREAIAITTEALPWLGCATGRIGVCGLNPHAGDGGVLGSEEGTIIAPVIGEFSATGGKVNGPIPADVIFYQAVNGQFDAVVAMYHDQGLGPLKMLAFDCGINMTLGLPIIRVSPDHGTAFNIAGKNSAHTGSMLAALRTAFDLAQRPNPWKTR